MAFAPRLCALCLVAVALNWPVFAAEEDKDLELIPQAPQQPAAPPPEAAPATGSNRNYLENAFAVTPLRGNLAVPFPPPQPPQWNERLFLDTRDEWRLADELTLNYSGRFNFRAGQNLEFPSHENILNELREAFLSWQPVDGSWVDVGRVNVKSGVAVGFNPTDFFKTRTVVEPLTVDPTVLREDRLGTLMVLGQHVWTGGSLTVLYAPQVTLPTAIYRDNNLPNFDPMLDRTNAQNRVLVKGSVTLTEGLAPELVLYNAGGHTQIGANLTVGLGKQVVGYAEWAGGVQANLISSALGYGRETGSLPRTAPPVVPNSTAQWFQNALSVGFSWTPETPKVTLNVEYHLNEAGFTQKDWNNWFAAAARHGNIPGVNSTLWYIRAYAADQQQPLSRNGLFLRADWVDAIVPDLELTAIASINPVDGSAQVQATADYYISRSWTVGVLASFDAGGRHTEYGSLPQVGSFLVRLIRYL